MIEKLRWVVNFNRTKTLQAYDGHEWFAIPEISYAEEAEERNPLSLKKQIEQYNDYQGPERRIRKRGDKPNTQPPVIK